MTRPEPLRWHVGDVTVTRVEELVTAVPAEYLLPGSTRERIDALRPWISPFFTDDGELLLSVHSFVVEADDTTIVVDTCAGAHHGRRLQGDPSFIERLDRAIDGGLGAVDVVVCTHLHFDHIGWNTTQSPDGSWAPAFPNARYLVSDVELAGFVDEDDVAASSITPLVAARVLDRVPLDHQITPSVRLVPTTGHTPGHVSVAIHSDDAEALITGDATHSPIQFAFPDIAASRVDHDSAASTATRHDLIARLIDTDTLVLGTHFAPPTGGVLRSDDSDAAARFVLPG